MSENINQTDKPHYNMYLKIFKKYVNKIYYNRLELHDRIGNPLKKTNTKKLVGWLFIVLRQQFSAICDETVLYQFIHNFVLFATVYKCKLCVFFAQCTSRFSHNVFHNFVQCVSRLFRTGCSQIFAQCFSDFGKMCVQSRTHCVSRLSRNVVYRV